MKKVLFTLSLMLLVGTVGTTVYAATSTVDTEVEVNTDKKKKKKKKKSKKDSKKKSCEKSSCCSKK